jgi:hypothetical protein
LNTFNLAAASAHLLSSVCACNQAAFTWQLCSTFLARKHTPRLRSVVLLLVASPLTERTLCDLSQKRGCLPLPSPEILSTNCLRLRLCRSVFRFTDPLVCVRRYQCRFVKIPRHISAVPRQSAFASMRVNQQVKFTLRAAAGNTMPTHFKTKNWRASRSPTTKVMQTPTRSRFDCILGFGIALLSFGFMHVDHSQRHAVLLVHASVLVQGRLRCLVSGRSRCRLCYCCPATARL